MFLPLQIFNIALDSLWELQIKGGSTLMPKTVGGLIEPEQSLRSPWLKKSNSMDSIGTLRVKETHQLLSVQTTRVFVIWDRWVAL